MKRNWLAYPYILWILVFVLFPMVLVLGYGVVVKTDTGFALTLQHLQRVFEPIYLKVIWRSIVLAFISTVICLFLGYPVAMILANQNFKQRNVFLALIVIPMWMNFLARTYAWMSLLEKNGLVNRLLSFLGLPNLNILYTDYAVVLGMVYNFLPFMILPIYAVLSKTDRSLIEAAEDLGATPSVIFRRITFPLSLPGVFAGIIMVFLPAVTTFAISRLLGGGHYMLIGNLIEQQFLTTQDWSFGAALSTVLLIGILLIMKVLGRYERDSGGGVLW